MTDPHDPRQFRQWITFNPDGTVAATHEVASWVDDPPMAGGIDVTTFAPADFSTLRVDPKLLTAVDSAKSTIADQEAALVVAKHVHATATREVVDAIGLAVLAQQVKPVT